MTTSIPTVAIVGRTNVGKSTLFNTLAGRRISIVEDIPGVTRDRNYTFVTRHGFPFTLIDTGGFVGEEEHGLHKSVRRQAEVAVEEADLVLAVFDGLNGPIAEDNEVVSYLRISKKPVIWVVNKCEKPDTEIQAAEFYSLGLEELVFISAVHKTHVPELVTRIREKLGVSDDAQPGDETDEISDEAEAADRPIRIAFLGRPNAGKSTLLNRIVGEERIVTSPIAGTTTDNIDISIKRGGRLFTVVDTAGLRKKARVEDLTVERYSNLRSLRALAGCDVAALVIDGPFGVSEQDAKIAGLAHERGRALIIIINKWDAVEKDHLTVTGYKEAVGEVLKFAPYAPILFVSALSGRRCPSILEKAATVYDEARRRVATSELNRTLKRIFETKPPPVYRGEPVKFYFATQASVAPPTVVLFSNHPTRINFSYQRYIKNMLRKEFSWAGSDIKLVMRKRTERGSDQSGSVKRSAS